MVKDYIPKGKGDVEAVKKLQLLPFEAIKADVPRLLECLQDMNWEIASCVADYFLPHINDIKHDLLDILLGDDISWKYWILGSLIRLSPNRPPEELMVVIKRIANNPTKIEQQEEVDLAAKEVIERYP